MQSGEEKLRIERVGLDPAAPISSISFSPIKDEDGLDILVAVDWAQTMACYDLSGKQVRESSTYSYGRKYRRSIEAYLFYTCRKTVSCKQVGKERELGFDPLGAHFFCKGEYILVSGSNRQALMYSREGVLISSLCEMNAWIWSGKWMFYFPNGHLTSDFLCLDSATEPERHADCKTASPPLAVTIHQLDNNLPVCI